LPLTDIAMVAGDTSRSRAYLQALARNDILPNFVLVLEDSSEELLPGQMDKLASDELNEQSIENNECWSESHFDPAQPIKVLLDRLGVNYNTTNSKDINNSQVIDCIRQRSESVFIYSGFGGGLLRKEILSLGKNFLHVHGGYLPDFKGSTTNYYSLLVDNTLGASSIFLNEEIDCGPILLREKFPSPINKLKIDHIYDSGARAKVLVKTIQNYVKSGTWKFELPDNLGGETYYIIHPVLKHMAILAQNKGDSCE
jgi:methionyl-tRNA formyltransferase